MNYKIVTTQNLLIILFSKSLALCINLLAAKLLPKEQFGFFVYYILILSFAPLLQLSSLKGLILLYPKEKMNTANSIHFFQNYNTFSIMMHTLTSLAIFLFDLNVSLPIMFCIYFSLLFEKYIENRYVFFSTNHLGTHIDLPFHFYENGKKLDKFEPESWFYNSVSLVDFPCNSAKIIAAKDLQSFTLAPETEILLIRTGFER